MIVASILVVSAILFPAFAQGGSSQYADENNERIRISGPATYGGYPWDPQNFAGFYYDLDGDLGTESLNYTFTGYHNISGSPPYGLTYQTSAQEKPFKFREWGSYWVIGFLGKKCLAGYMESEEGEKNFLSQKSQDKSSLAKGQLEEVLQDDDTELTLTTATPLDLAQGYQLAIERIDVDGNNVYLELTKDGEVVDDKVISPSRDHATMADKTYYYKAANVGEAREVVIIAVHFKNAFRGADQDLATLDGIFQISDEPLSVKPGTVYDKMTVSEASGGHIAMDNRGNTIILSKNKDIVLAGDIHLRIADQKAGDSIYSLKCYPYVDIYPSGSYEIRGAVPRGAYVGDYYWNPQNFAGFYYNPDDDTGKEELHVDARDGENPQIVASDSEPYLRGDSQPYLSGDEPYGLTYTTVAQEASFSFQGWGSYYVIGFLGKKCFAGYPDGPGSEKGLLSEKSLDKDSLAKGQVVEILLDDDAKTTVSTDKPLKLRQGYVLKLISIDAKGERVYVRLLRDGKAVDDKQLNLMGNSTLADTTFYHKETVGSQKNLVTIAAHFKNAFVAGQKGVATVDGIWQLSSEPIPVQEGSQFDKMTVQTLDPTEQYIFLANKGNTITLSRNKVTLLMGDICLRTADSDILRYYVCKEGYVKSQGIN